MRGLDSFIATLLAIALATAILWVLPMGIWFEVRSVQVLDSVVGQSPRMIVDRTIRMPFTASWSVTVLNIREDGFEPICSASGQNDYDTTNLLPVDLDLDWWTWPTKCTLPVGQFVVRTVWTIPLFGALRKDIRVLSNPFKITAVEADDVGSEMVPSSNGRAGD